MEYEKFEGLMTMTNRENRVKQRTFYRYLVYVERAVEKIWKEEQERLKKLIMEKHQNNTLGDLFIAVDAGWHKRGHTSEFGNFAAVLVSKHEELNNKVLWATSKAMKRLKTIKGVEKEVYSGNY